jgi:hypothetical protein
MDEEMNALHKNQT